MPDPSFWQGDEAPAPVPIEDGFWSAPVDDAQPYGFSNQIGFDSIAQLGNVQKMADAGDGSAEFVLSTAGVPEQELEAFLGLENGALDALGLGNATNGSALLLSFGSTAALSGDVQWLFNAGDYLPYNDFAFVLDEDGAVPLSSVAAVGNYGDSGWQTDDTLVFPGDGGLTLGVGVVNVRDSAQNSSFTVIVPEGKGNNAFWLSDAPESAPAGDDFWQEGAAEPAQPVDLGWLLG